MKLRRRTLVSMACTLAASAVVSQAHAQQDAAYPNKPIRLVVPYPAGGGFDTVARKLADGLRERLKVAVIVDNKPGANTEIATTAVVRSPADGYTLLMNAPAGIVQGPWLQKSMPYDPIKDLQPLYMVAQVPTALIVPTSLGVNNFSQFKTYVQQHREKLAYASLGSGSTFHIFGAMLNDRLKAEATHVPYKGDAPAMSDLIPGRVQFMFNNPVSAINFAKQDKVRILAVSGPTRLPAAKDVPTLGELGMPEFNIVGWYGLFAPANTPRAISDKIANTVSEVMRDRSVLDYLETVGVLPGDSGVDKFTKQVKEEYQAWGALIKQNDIHVD